MSRYTHLTISEREDIMPYRARGFNASRIAALIGRPRCTVWREPTRNSFASGYAGRARTYRASTAQKSYERRRAACRRQRLLSNRALVELIVPLIRDLRWSPQQVEARLRVEKSIRISDTSIYRAIRTGGWDCYLSGRRFSRRLRFKGERRTRLDTDRRGLIKATHELAERDPIVEKRSRIGDWEGDAVAGIQGGACLVTMVDRMSGFVAGGLAASKTAGEVERVTVAALEGRPVHTVTVDRGKEFARAARMQERLHAPVYFCPARQPWQRGTNENTNGLLRDFHPKGVSLNMTSAVDVARSMHCLNLRPRKRLNWKTPYEVHYDIALHLL